MTLLFYINDIKNTRIAVRNGDALRRLPISHACIWFRVPIDRC